MRCMKCKSRKATKSGVLGGVYYSQLCDPCLINSRRSVSTGTASYNRQRDLEDHTDYMVQPYAGGKPNAEFIRLYPERANQLFTYEQMKDAVRS